MEIARDSLHRSKFAMHFCGSALSQLALPWLSEVAILAYPSKNPRPRSSSEHKLQSDHENIVENNFSCFDTEYF